MTEEMRQAIRLVLAMMRSASTANIAPKRWWERARTALETGASAEDFPAMVSTMARKLQIDALISGSALVIDELTHEIEDWESFRRLCESKAVYVVGMAQAQRKAEREEEAAIKQARADERAYKE